MNTQIFLLFICSFHVPFCTLTNIATCLQPLTEDCCFSGEGVAGIEAEAELLAAMVMFFQRVGLTAQDVVIKVSSRQLLQAVLEQHEIAVDATSRVFVTVDKMDKVPKEAVRPFTGTSLLLRSL